MVKINNKEYAWGDITVVVLGRPIIGITGIEYTAKKVKEQRYGSGRDVKSIQHGRREPEGTITLMQSEVIAMNQAAKQNGYRDALDIEVGIIVTYASDDGIVSVDKIIGASFSELPKGMKEGDLQSEHAMPFVALDIEEDAV
jgi:hypothetical protein